MRMIQEGEEFSLSFKLPPNFGRVYKNSLNILLQKDGGQTQFLVRDTEVIDGVLFVSMVEGDSSGCKVAHVKVSYFRNEKRFMYSVGYRVHVDLQQELLKRRSSVKILEKFGKGGKTKDKFDDSPGNPIEVVKGKGKGK